MSPQDIADIARGLDILRWVPLAMVFVALGVSLSAALYGVVAALLQIHHEQTAAQQRRYWRRD